MVVIDKNRYKTLRCYSDIYIYYVNMYLVDSCHSTGCMITERYDNADAFSLPLLCHRIKYQLDLLEGRCIHWRQSWYWIPMNRNSDRYDRNFEKEKWKSLCIIQQFSQRNLWYSILDSKWYWYWYTLNFSWEN